MLVLYSSLSTSGLMDKALEFYQRIVGSSPRMCAIYVKSKDICSMLITLSYRRNNAIDSSSLHMAEDKEIT